MYFEISVKIVQCGSQQKLPWKKFLIEQTKGLINSFNISKLVIIAERIVKFHQKTAKFRTDIWQKRDFEGAPGVIPNGFCILMINSTMALKIKVVRRPSDSV